MKAFAFLPVSFLVLSMLSAGLVCQAQSGADVTATINSAIGRLQSADIKQRGVALIMLRNREATAAIPALIQMLGNETEFPQMLLGQTGDSRAISALLAALQDPYINVRINAAKALGELRSAEALELLLHMLSSDETASRQAAAEALGELGDTRAMNALVSMVMREDGWDWEIPVACGLQALSKLGHNGASIALKRYSRHLPDWKEWWSQNKTRLLGP